MVDRLPPEYEQMPLHLILDLEVELRQLYVAMALSSGIYDYEPEEVLAEILLYIHPSWLDVECLEEFCDNCRLHFPEDRDTVVLALESLGKSLLRHLHVCKAYTSDGRLHYTVAPKHRWVNAFTPVFLRHAELRRPRVS